MVKAAVSVRYDLASIDYSNIAHLIQQSYVVVMMVQLEFLVQYVPGLLRNAPCFDGTKVLPLSVKDKRLSEIKERLESSFLGETYRYVIGDIEQLSPSLLSSCIQYLNTYAGPHHIIIACQAQASFLTAWKGIIVSIPQEMPIRRFHALCAAWFPKNVPAQVLESLASRNDVVQLDAAVALIPYIPILGKSLVGPFKDMYLPRIVSNDEISLFALTDAWWQKKSAVFYQLWSRSKQLYTEQFWIVFWSDQLFRGYVYAYYMHQRSDLLARQIAARKLSFFYVKTGWRTSKLSQLQQLHAMLYTLDYTSKTGGTADMLELMYVSWFSGHMGKPFWL